MSDLDELLLPEDVLFASTHFRCTDFLDSFACEINDLNCNQDVLPMIMSVDESAWIGCDYNTFALETSEVLGERLNRDYPDIDDERARLGAHLEAECQEVLIYIRALYESLKLTCSANKMPAKRIIFLEGPSAVGKTTVSTKSFDYSFYKETVPLFQEKKDSIVQSLYQSRVTGDIINFLKIKNDQKYEIFEIIDRSMFSCVIYDVLFKCNGHMSDPEKFKRDVLDYLSSDIRSEVRKMFNDWLTILEGLVPGVKVTILWVKPTNLIKVTQMLESRKSFEVIDNYNLYNYVVNQNFLFQEFWKISCIGECFEIESLLFPHMFENNK